jgi:hypothetical protein
MGGRGSKRVDVEEQLVGSWVPTCLDHWQNCPVPIQDRLQAFRYDVSRDGSWVDGLYPRHRGQVQLVSPGQYHGYGKEPGKYKADWTLQDDGVLRMSWAGGRAVYLLVKQGDPRAAVPAPAERVLGPPPAERVLGPPPAGGGAAVGPPPAGGGAAVQLGGWEGYNSRFNGRFVQHGPDRGGRPVFRLEGQDWCRMFWANGYWKLGHESWVHGDSRQCCAGVRSYAQHPSQIPPSETWYEHKGSRPGHDYGNNPKDFKPRHGVHVVGGGEGGGGAALRRQLSASISPTSAFIRGIGSRSEEEIRTIWSRLDNDVLPEYHQASQLMCLTPHWVSHTRLGRYLRAIDTEMKSDSALRAMGERKHYKAIVLRVILKGYQLKDLKAARKQDDAVVGCNIFKAMVQFCFDGPPGHLGGGKPQPGTYVGYALHVLEQHGDPASIVAKLSEVCDRTQKCRTARECHVHSRPFVCHLPVRSVRLRNRSLPVSAPESVNLMTLTARADWLQTTRR